MRLHCGLVVGIGINQMVFGLPKAIGARHERIDIGVGLLDDLPVVDERVVLHVELLGFKISKVIVAVIFVEGGRVDRSAESPIALFEEAAA